MTDLFYSLHYSTYFKTFESWTFIVYDHLCFCKNRAKIFILFNLFACRCYFCTYFKASGMSNSVSILKLVVISWKISICCGATKMSTGWFNVVGLVQNSNWSICNCVWEIKQSGVDVFLNLHYNRNLLTFLIPQVVRL